MQNNASKILDNNRLIIAVLFLAAFNIFVWRIIVSTPPGQNAEPKLYFLNVGQGDAELVELPQPSLPLGMASQKPVRVLIDGGPDQSLLRELDKILPPTDRYIDLVIMTHPQLDHFAGLIEVFRRYQVGAFLFNGRTADGAFHDLETAVKENKIPAMQILEGDKIKYLSNIFDVLSPNAEFLQSAELNDTSVVLLFNHGNAKALFTADIGMNVEHYLTTHYPSLSAAMLKVPHHGSKFSSGEEFLNAIRPKVAVIEVGKNNTYGHPTKEALSRLEAVGAKIYRTDLNGTVKMIIKNDRIQISH